jgi:4-carboxymuconolactone decarboxylase
VYTREKQNAKTQRGAVKKEELIEVITHLAFYSGWPNALSAIMVAKGVFLKA